MKHDASSVEYLDKMFYHFFFQNPCEEYVQILAKHVDMYEMHMKKHCFPICD